VDIKRLARRSGRRAFAPSPAAPPITAASINDAAPKGANDKDPSPIAKAEVLLDRAHFSPGATIQMRAQRSTPFSGLSNRAIMRSARTMAGRQTTSRTRTLCGLETGLGLDLKEEVDR